MQGELFDGIDYEEPRVEGLGERPALTAQDWLSIADQMHDEGNDLAREHALTKHDIARHFEGTTEFVGGTALFGSMYN